MELNEAIRRAEEKAKEIRKANEEMPTDCKLSEELCECAKEHEQLAEWLTELQERREADRWISIDEKLPDKNGNYLVLLDNGGITTDIFDEEELFMGFWGYMTHWRPLPKAPESEGE